VFGEGGAGLNKPVRSVPTVAGGAERS
jgi:hypothetical protein